MSDVTLTIVETPIEVDLTVTKGITSVAFDEITGSARDNTDLNSELDLKEDSLSNPSTDGYILSSTIAGVRSWIAKSAGAVWGSITGNITDQTDLKNALDAKLSLTGTTSALDMNSQDVIGVKDLECNIIESTKAGDVGGVLIGAEDILHLADPTIDFDRWRGWDDITYSSRIIQTDPTLKIQCGGSATKGTHTYTDVVSLANTIVSIHKPTNIYGTTDHKNQDVTNVKDLDCATIDVGNGATGSFTSSDGKTVTVTKGIITSIV